MGMHITGDDHIHFSSELANKPMTNGERKKMMALEHNRRYEEEKLNPTDPRVAITKVLRDVVGNARKELGIS